MNTPVIAPHATVGTSSNTVTKHTFDTVSIFLIVLFILFIIVVAILFVYLARRGAAYKPTPNLPPSNNQNTTPPEVGAVRYPASNVGCNEYYYGATCQQQQYDNRYKQLDVQTTHTVMATHSTPQKSFTTDSCSYLCDTTKGCMGFTYNETSQLCQTLSGITITSLTPLVAHTNTYVVDKTHRAFGSYYLQIPDYVFVASHMTAVPRRYWLSANHRGFAKLKLGVVHKLPFFPTIIKNDSAHIGFYSPVPFTLQDLPSLASRPKTSTQKGREELTLPSMWQHEPYIYVVYVVKNEDLLKSIH